MKKMKLLTLTLAMLLLVTGCGSKNKEGDAGTTAAKANASAATEAATEASGKKEEAAPAGEDGYVFKKGDVTISMGAPADDIISALGTYKKTYEAESCAFDGMDVVYSYAGFDVLTFKKDGTNIITGVVLRDDTQATPEGIYVGSDKAAVEKAYGQKPEEGVNNVQLKKGNSDLLIIFKDDLVNSIQYSLAQ